MFKRKSKEEKELEKKQKEEEKKRKEEEKRRKEEEKKLQKQKKKQLESDKEKLQYHLTQFLKLLAEMFYSPSDKWYVILIIAITMVLFGMIFGMILGSVVKPYIMHPSNTTVTKIVPITVTKVG